MQQNIVPISENGVISLSQTKSAIALTDKLLGKNIVLPDDDAWMERLWKWADENGIGDTDEFDLFCLCNDETRFALAKQDNGLLEKVKELERLSGRQFSVLYFKYWQNNSTDEIAKEMGYTKSRIRQFNS
jgi:DNA-directed RNA polymerase specialized sigma subunit